MENLSNIFFKYSTISLTEVFLQALDSNCLVQHTGQQPSSHLQGEIAELVNGIIRTTTTNNHNVLELK